MIGLEEYQGAIGYFNFRVVSPCVEFCGDPRNISQSCLWVEGWMYKEALFICESFVQSVCIF